MTRGDDVDSEQNTEQRAPIREAMLVLGIALIAVGCWFVYPPLAAIVPGCILTTIAVFGVR